MIVEVFIPDKDWWQLAEVAETRGTHVPDMLAAAVADVIAAAWSLDDVIWFNVRAGMPDAEIARRTGATVHLIAQHRRRLGLKANKRFGGRGLPARERNSNMNASTQKAAS